MWLQKLKSSPRPGASIEMDEILDFDCFYLGKAFHPYNVTQTLLIFVKLKENTFLGMSKVRAWSILTLAMP